MRKRGKTAEPLAHTLQSAFFRAGETGFAGHVFDQADLDRRFVVELLVDGIPVRAAIANAFVQELAAKGVGDGCFGFSFFLPELGFGQSTVIELRLANLNTPVGVPINCSAAARIEKDWRGSGEVRWLGGVRFMGWCTTKNDATPTVTATIDGKAVARSQATQWTHLGSGENITAVRAFDLNVPDRFADGRVHRVRFVSDSATNISPAPVAFVAFPDGLARTLEQLGEIETEKLRGELFDRLLPMSLPFSDYRCWRERFPVLADRRHEPAIAIVLIGPGSTEISMQSIESQHYPDWVAAAMPKEPSPTAFDPRLLNDFLKGDAAHCDIVLITLNGSRLHSHALHRAANALVDRPDAAAVYFDFDIESEDGTIWPTALPAFDYERMLEQGYCAHVFAMRRSLVEKAVAAGASNVYRLFNSALDRNEDAARQIVHAPGAFAIIPQIASTSASHQLVSATAEHLKARGTSATISKGNGTWLPAIRVTRAMPQGLASIIIPVRNKPSLLRACLASIEPALSATPAEILIVDNDSSDPEMLDYLQHLEGKTVRVLRVPGNFNFARLNNIAAKQAKGDFLCLLNNDIEACDNAWLCELLSRISDTNVGAVGALLVWPSGVVQHGGVVLGPNFAATHAFNDRLASDPGYADMLRVAHEASAVTAACLLTRRSDYLIRRRFR